MRGFAAYADRNAPSITYPFVSRAARKYMVPIYPEYHTELLPDSILRTESPLDYVEHKPNRNAIRKAYISRSIRKDMRPGDIIVVVCIGFLPFFLVFAMIGNFHF